MPWFSQSDDFFPAREKMVRTQLKERGIRDSRVLAAMLEVPRHEFVLPEFRDVAYDDHPLPIGLGQTISQPYIVALMLQYLELQPADRVLEVGTGSGYVAALLSRICGEVYSIERHADLARNAESTLRRLGHNKVQVRAGDGSHGWIEHAPFDAILVSAATSSTPSPLFEQLREGGRMVVPVGSSSTQQLQRIRKVNGKAETEDLEGCRFVPLIVGAEGVV